MVSMVSTWIYFRGTHLEVVWNRRVFEITSMNSQKDLANKLKVFSEKISFNLLFDFKSWEVIHFIFDQVKDLLLPLQIRSKLFHEYRPSKVMVLTTSEFIHKSERLNHGR